MEPHTFDMEAAVDVQDFAGHGTREIAGEQQGRPAYFRRLDGASKRGRNRGCVQKLVEMLDAGRRAGCFASIVELAETTGAAVWDVNNALNFPNKHPLCLSMDRESLRRTDLVVGLDVKDWEKQLTELNSAKRTREQITPPSCDFVEIGFGEINISKWAFDYCRMQPCSIRAR